jgi:hypothetical protein
MSKEPVVRMPWWEFCDIWCHWHTKLGCTYVRPERPAVPENCPALRKPAKEKPR